MRPVWICGRAGAWRDVTRTHAIRAHGRKAAGGQAESRRRAAREAALRPQSRRMPQASCTLRSSAARTCYRRVFPALSPPSLSCLEDLQPPCLVGQPDLHLHLQPPWAQQRLVQHVLSIRHADEQDVIESVDSVNLGQQLVDNRVVHAAAVAHATARLRGVCTGVCMCVHVWVVCVGPRVWVCANVSWRAAAATGSQGLCEVLQCQGKRGAAAHLADGVDLVKDDDMQLGGVAELLVIKLSLLQRSGHRGHVSARWSGRSEGRRRHRAAGWRGAAVKASYRLCHVRAGQPRAGHATPGQARVQGAGHASAGKGLGSP